MKTILDVTIVITFVMIAYKALVFMFSVEKETNARLNLINEKVRLENEKKAEIKAYLDSLKRGDLIDPLKLQASLNMRTDHLSSDVIEIIQNYPSITFDRKESEKTGYANFIYKKV